jgi:hypothetical protein
MIQPIHLSYEAAEHLVSQKARSVLFHPRCHPEATFNVRYVRSTGLLEVFCAACGEGSLLVPLVHCEDEQ